MKRTFVAAIGSGFGDVLISLPVVQSLIETDEHVVLVTRSFRQVGIAERVVGLKGEVPESELCLQPGDRYVNLREHPLQLNHVWGSTEFELEFGKTNIERIIANIASDFGIKTDFANLTPLWFERRKDLSSAVAFVPGTDMFYKHWPHENWLRLYQVFSRQGRRIIVMGKPDESPAVERLISAGIEYIETPTAALAIDVISSCAAVISVDTGLMHTAVQQGVPTYAFIHPQNFHTRSNRNCFNLHARQCPEKCRRDFSPPAGYADPSKLAVGLKFDRRECSLAIEESCMGAISTDAVISLLNNHGLLHPLTANAEAD